MEFTDYYAVLGVPRDATQDRIKTAYRALARKLHPDVNKDASAEERFKRVNEAYEVLKDPEKRAKYDRLGASWQEVERQQEFERQWRERARPSAGGGRTGGFSDFFQAFFGDGGVDLDELLRQAGGGAEFGDGGGGRAFRFGTDGGGSRGFRFGTDAGADPFGLDSRPRRGSDLEDEVTVTLEEAMHGGRRLLQVGARQVEVRIPAGVADGSKVRVGGEGGPGAGGGPRGDVYLRVRLAPHPRFAPQGRDLLADLPVRDDQAVLGAQVPFRALGGDVTVRVPARTRAGARLRLRGKGLPGLKGGAAGDLLLTVRVTVPADPSSEERAVYQRLAELRGAVAAADASGAAASDTATSGATAAANG